MREGFEVFSHSVRAVAVVGFSPPVIGDREKPGARLDRFCFGAHRGIQRDSGSGGHSRARSAPPPSLAPGFSRSLDYGLPGVMEPKTALRCSVLWTALTPRM